VILDFQTNSLTTVEPIEQGLWRVASRFDDKLFSAEVTLDIKAPALDIRAARLDVKRDVLGLIPDLSSAAGNLIGVRVGPGMTKIVRAVVAGESGSRRVADMVLEAMEMLVNAITVPELKKASETGGETVSAESDGPRVYLNDIVVGDAMARVMGSNPRLKDSCAAFRGL
jgi:hypothetical protein